MAHSNSTATPKSIRPPGHPNAVAVRGKQESIALAASIALQTTKEQEESAGSGSPSTSSTCSRKQQCQVKVLPLYAPEDSEWLSAPLCITRQQIQVFSATPADVKARSSMGGRLTHIAIGSVGIRCRHCAHLPPKDRAPGAVTYPKSVKNMHQAVRNFQRWHFMACEEIPTPAKEEFLSFPPKDAQSKKNSAEYWIRSCRRMGMVDADASDGNDGGIRFLEAAGREEHDDGAKDDNDTNAREANAANATEMEGGGQPVVEGHSVAAFSSKMGTSCKKSTERDRQTIKTGFFFSSEDDTGFNLQALGNEITPLDANDSSNKSLASFDTDTIERLNFSQKRCDADGLQDSDPRGGFCSELGSPSDVPPSIMSKSESPVTQLNVRADTESLDHLDDLDFDEDFDDLDVDDIFSADELGDDEFLLQLDVSAKRHNGPDEMSRDEVLSGECTSISSDVSARGDGVVEGVLSGANIREEHSNVVQGVSTGAKVAEEHSNETRNIRSRGDLLESVRLACNLTKRARECYEKGMTNVHDDLKSLGCDIYQLFTGVDPFERNAESSCGIDPSRASTDDRFVTEGGPAKKKREQQSTECSCVPLRDLGFPVVLSSLVSSLMGARDNEVADHYNILKEVEEDLSLMTANPDRYLHDVNGEKLSGELMLPEGKLYGRENHTSELMSAFGRVIGSGGVREVVLVSGYSGTGKSVLAEQVRKPLTEKNGSFISGKFDELGQVQPLAVIFAAFNDYCNELLESGGDILIQMSQEIKDALGSDFSVLTALMPNLVRVIGESESTSVSVEGKNAMHRLSYLFKLFVRAIAKPSHPVILFLDDLQWADEASLGLLTTLVSDADMSSLLFMGAYRDNEVGMDHPLNAVLENIAHAGISTLAIKLDNIDNEAVNELVSDALHLMPRMTRSLGDVVYAKTSGNPLFVVQFLRSLYDEHLLMYSASSRRWEWDVEAIQAKDIANSVVDLMKTKMLKLDPAAQYILKVAACLGSRSEASTLQLLKLDEGSSNVQYLHVIVCEGLMSRVGSCYKFSHDQIQQAAYSLIPELEKEALHLGVGRLLWTSASAEELDKLIFVVVDQLSRGSDLITDHDEKVKVAELCLMAGEKAMASSAFLPSSIYLLQGTAFLEERDWDLHYDLSLRLYTCCAEAQYIIGNFIGVTITSNLIFAHARSFQDRLRAHCTVLNSLGSQEKPSDAIRYGLDVLKQYGEHLPNDPNSVQTLIDFGKTRMMVWKASLVDGMSVVRIAEKDEMKDADKIAVMKLILLLSSFARRGSQELMAMIIFRSVQVSLSHGVCRDSPAAFAAFGLVMCSFAGIEHGYQYGKLALALLDRFKDKALVARVYAVVYSSIHNFVEPLQAGLPLLKDGYEKGMATGDIEWGFGCAKIYLQNSIQSGVRLQPLSEEGRAYVQQMEEQKHHALVVTVPYLQAILNLLGCPEDPTVLTGEVMDEDELLHRAQESMLDAETALFFNRMWLAYLFGNIVLAGEMARYILEKCINVPSQRQALVDNTFYSGLTAVAMVRRGDSVCEWRNIADEAVKKMKSWVESSEWNFRHKLNLLVAEIAYLNGDMDKAVKAYDDAIHVAGQHGFIHEQALACERAGIFYSETFSSVVADDYFERAQKYYHEWGAKRKANYTAQRSHLAGKGL